jgi:Tol biopolymer transport system component
MTRVPLVFVAGLMLVAAGCQGPGIAQDEIPAEPIAFIYHPEAQARRRAEGYAKRQAPETRSGFDHSAIVNLNQARDYLEKIFGRRDTDDYAGQLSLLNPRNRQVTVLDSTRKGAIPLAWSPNRGRLLFAQWDLGTLQLFEFDRDSRAVAQITGGPDHHPQGCYGPDDRLIAVVAQRAGSTENSASLRQISRIAALGPGDAVEWISAGPADGEPTCSPDGSDVAYVRLSSGASSEIWIYSFADDRPSRSIAAGREPAFSPDGEWIVYSRDVGTTPALWRVRRDGTGRTRLGRGSGADEYGPTVSPDGSLVVYESVSGNRYRLFVRRFDGTGDSVLFSDGDGTHAVW